MGKGVHVGDVISEVKGRYGCGSEDVPLGIKCAS